MVTRAHSEVNRGSNSKWFARESDDTRFGRSNNNYQTSQSGGSKGRRRLGAERGRLPVRTAAEYGKARCVVYRQVFSDGILLCHLCRTSGGSTTTGGNCSCFICTSGWRPVSLRPHFVNARSMVLCVVEAASGYLGRCEFDLENLADIETQQQRSCSASTRDSAVF